VFRAQGVGVTGFISWRCGRPHLLVWTLIASAHLGIFSCTLSNPRHTLPNPTPTPTPTQPPQDQHVQLLRAQEVLQAELSMALGSYQPKATIDSGTPADKLLAMMTELLDGSLPNLQDILLIQSTILEVRPRAGRGWLRLGGGVGFGFALGVLLAPEPRHPISLFSLSRQPTRLHNPQSNPTQPNAYPHRPATSTSPSAWASS